MSHLSHYLNSTSRSLPLFMGPFPVPWYKQHTHLHSHTHTERDTYVKYVNIYLYTYVCKIHTHLYIYTSIHVHIIHIIHIIHIYTYTYTYNATWTDNVHHKNHSLLNWDWYQTYYVVQAVLEPPSHPASASHMLG